MTSIDRHEQLITEGLKLHEGRDYESAQLFFQRAIADCPNCVVARYNLANTLHTLYRDSEATLILKNLLATDDEILFDGCPLNEDPTPFKIDTLYLMFLTILGDTGNWDDAYQFGLQHLEARKETTDFLFSDEYVATEMEALKLEFKTHE